MNPYNWQEYEIIKEKALSNKSFKVFIIIFLIGMMFLICKFNFKVYEKYILIKDNSNYNIIVSIENINEISNNNIIYINNKKYHYEINSISDKVDNINGLLYKNISISINNYKMLNDYDYIYILKNKDTFLNMIIKFITGGFYG